MKGYTYKRCHCGVVRDSGGKRVNCQKRHGSWYYVHELPPAPDGRRRQTFRGGFSTEREARQALNQALDAVNSGEWVEPRQFTVAEYLDRWIAGKAGLRRSRTRSASIRRAAPGLPR
jgi:hypothetical protein